MTATAQKSTSASRDDPNRAGLFRGALYVALIGLNTLVLGTPCLIITLFKPHSEVSYAILRAWARLLLWTCGVSTEAAGTENIPAEGSFLLMSTHNGHFDVPVLMKEVPRQFRIVAKKVLFKIPIFGWILTTAGYVSVDRGDRAQAFASMDKAAEGVKSGMPLLIFPEGTRSPDGSLGPFKKGGFVLATRAGAPLVPVVVSGTYGVLPKTTWRIRPGHVKVTFCEPIDTSSYSYENKEELMDKVRETISKALESEKNESRKPGLTHAV